MCKLDVLCSFKQLMTWIQMAIGAVLERAGSFFPTAGTAAHELSQNMKRKRFSSFLKPSRTCELRSVQWRQRADTKWPPASLLVLFVRKPRSDVLTDRWHTQKRLYSGRVCSEYVFVCVWTFGVSIWGIHLTLINVACSVCFEAPDCLLISPFLKTSC